MKNGWAVKILTTLIAALLLAAIIGGFTLSREVSARGATIEALTEKVGELGERVRDLERAIYDRP
ncbi:MAG: hypothetical protein V3S40_06925 [Kiloniellales bacterium]